MAKECKANQCSNSRFGKGYCKFHQWMRPEVVAKAYAPKKRARIKTVSDRLASELSIYNPRAKEYKQENPECQARVSGVCTYHTSDVHHKKGRGIYLLDEDYWMPICRPCHTWIDLNPIQAKEMGLVVK